jgi:hypothetical protein
MKLFRQISIWTRLDHERAARFNCIEDLGVRKFTVQSKDFFSIPIDEKRLAYFERLFPERIIETEWEQHRWFDSIEEAVAAHDEEFR